MTNGPEAVFVVERLPGRGYVVTSATGHRSQVLAPAALAILDRLGQPDPRGPDEVQRWLPDAGPDHQPVYVRIHRTSEGESVYRQTWFPPIAPVVPPKRRRGYGWLVLAAMLFVSGSAFGWWCRPLPLQPIAQPEPTPIPVPKPTQVTRNDAWLQVPLRKASEPRRKLAEFLRQPGLTGWPEEAGLVERTVELRDFRKTPRGVKIDPVYLTADEARALRSLLETLESVP